MLTMPAKQLWLDDPHYMTSWLAVYTELKLHLNGDINHDNGGITCGTVCDQSPACQRMMELMSRDIGQSTHITCRVACEKALCVALCVTRLQLANR